MYVYITMNVCVHFYISTLNGYIGSTCNYIIYNVNGYIGPLLESVL